MSPRRWLSNTTKAVPASCGDGVIIGTQVPGGTPLARPSMRVQFWPPSRVTCTRPSSVPTQIVPARQRARRDGDDGGEVLRRGDVRGQPAAFLVGLPLRVVGGQVAADHGPGVAAVGRFVQELAAVVDRGRIERVLADAGVPVEAQLDAGFAVAPGGSSPARRCRGSSCTGSRPAT